MSVNADAIHIQYLLKQSINFEKLSTDVQTWKLSLGPQSFVLFGWVGS